MSRRQQWIIAVTHRYASMIKVLSCLYDLGTL
jgi:hypothetical protein